MDEQLRAEPEDLVNLMRAGRLPVERVAMAAFLGDARALATGILPWSPPAGATGSPAALVVDHGGFGLREAISLVVPFLERVMELDGWAGTGIDADPVALILGWLGRELTTEEVSRHVGPLPEGPGGTLNPPLNWFRLSAVFERIAASPDEDGDEERLPLSMALRRTRAGQEENEARLQGAEIAALLLDPAWPPAILGT